MKLGLRAEMILGIEMNFLEDVYMMRACLQHISLSDLLHALHLVSSKKTFIPPLSNQTCSNNLPYPLLNALP